MSHNHDHDVKLDVSCRNCDEHHENNEDDNQKLYAILTVSLSVILLAASFLPFLNEQIKLIFLLCSAILSGYELIPEAYEGIKEFKLDENLLVLISVVAAFLIGEGPEAAAVSLFFRIGENVEAFAVKRSKKAIEKLYEITSNKATVLNDDGEAIQIDAQDVKVGDTVIVAAYEKVPVDCIALEDGGTVDASAVTGESVPVEISEGTQVISGSINGSGILKLQAVSCFKDSTASKIIESVENSQLSKGKADKFITKFAVIYTPVVVVLAVLLALIPSLITGKWVKFIHRSLVFLVASCPCALVLSIPLGFFAAIGSQSTKGIIVKGGKYIEALAKADAVLFDKTGTLTDSKFEINKISAFNNFSKSDVLTIAAYAEKYSTHPLAQTIANACPNIKEKAIKNFEEFAGNGTKITLAGKEILCGSKKFMLSNDIDICNTEGAQVYVAVNGVLAGAVFLSGKLRKNSKSTVDELRKLGIKKIVMLTGDNEIAAKTVADKCGITEYHSSLMPNQKTEILNQYTSNGFHPVFVGDGINDTPTLAVADVGIAMGSGSAAAIEVGDVVLMNSNPESISSSIKMSKHAMNVIKFNIIFAIVIKIAVLILGAFGSAPMWAAVFADVGVCIIAVLNSSRLLLDKN